MRSVPRMLGWLHLTDLHVGQPKEAGRLANIERAFLEDLRRAAREEGHPLHVVFFTGDIAYRGDDGEYVRASAFLGRILYAVAELNAELMGDYEPEDPRAAPLLVPVPGNHDVVRPKSVEAEVVRQAFASRTPHSPGLWVAGQEGVRATLRTAFSPYERWLRRHPLPFPRTWRSGVIPGDRAVSIDRGGIRLGVLGLNSAYLHLGDGAYGTLHLDMSQFTSLCGPNTGGWVDTHDFNVLLTHHPPDWLSAVGRRLLEQEIRPDSLFDLHLFGHAHVGAHDPQPGSTGIRHLFQGRSLFGAEEHDADRLHGYTIGRFEVVDDANVGASKHAYIRPRRGWHDDHGWHFGPIRNGGPGSWRLQIDLGIRTRCGFVPQGPESVTWNPRLGRAVGPSDDPVWAAWDEEGNWREQLGVARWVFLSASVPAAPDNRDLIEDEAAFIQTGNKAAVMTFVRELAKGLVSSESQQLGLVFGGHPSITNALAPVALERGPCDSPWLVLWQHQRFWHVFVESVGVLVHLEGVLPVLFPDQGGELGQELRCMRTAILEDMNPVAAVFVGGLGGVLAEYELCRTRNIPCFPTGVGGGAAAHLLLEHEANTENVGAVGRLWYSPEVAAAHIVELLKQEASQG